MTHFVISKARQFIREIIYAPVEKLVRRVVPAQKQAAWLHRFQSWKRALTPQINEQIRQALADHPHPRAVIVFTPSLDWERQLFQRPQQLALALAKRGALVFYTQLRPLESGQALKQIAEGLYLGAIPLECFSQFDSFFAYTLTWNRKYLLKLIDPCVLYDYVDELSTFAGDPRQLSADHKTLLQTAAVVTATAKTLLEEIQSTRPDALLVPNGTDFAHFNRRAEPVTPPPELLDRQKPIIGYYGALASWFDYPLMLELARQRADLDFVLIGPAHDDSLEESGLAALENVVYLGPKPYAELPAYLACFNVAILPFRVNQITQATSPIKLFEYFAGGKPVVSTPLREVMQYPEVLIGADAGAFSRQLDRALSLRDDAGFIRRLQETARQNTWEARAESILGALDRFHKHTA